MSKSESFLKENKKLTILNFICSDKVCMAKEKKKKVNQIRRKKVRENEVVLEEILETIPYFVFWKDRNSNYLGANNRFAVAAGFKSTKDLVGKSDYDSCWTKEEADFFRSVDREVMEKNQPMLNIEEPQQQLDGSTKTLLTSKVPLHNSQGDVIGILGIYTDISSRKKLENEKDEALKELKEIQSQLIQAEKLRSLGEMAGGIAHEINNPLAIIKGTVYVIRKSIIKKTFDELKLLTYLDRIDDTLTRMKNIIQSMKNISRENELDTIALESVNDILNDVKALCGEKLSSLGVTMLVPDPKLTNSFLVCNRISLSQILLNLVSNANDAIKSLPEKWIKIEIVIGTTFQIRVVDSGIGVSQEIAAKMFQPFFTTKEIGSGTGIGLSLSKSLAQKQLANLSYDPSHPNTCFVIEFPLSSYRQSREAA